MISCGQPLLKNKRKKRLTVSSCILVCACVRRRVFDYPVKRKKRSRRKLTISTQVTPNTNFKSIICFLAFAQPFRFLGCPCGVDPIWLELGGTCGWGKVGEWIEQRTLKLNITAKQPHCFYAWGALAKIYTNWMKKVFSSYTENYVLIMTQSKT